MLKLKFSCQIVLSIINIFVSLCIVSVKKSRFSLTLICSSWKFFLAPKILQLLSIPADSRLAISSNVALFMWPDLVTECASFRIQSSQFFSYLFEHTIYLKWNGCNVFFMPPGITAKVADSALHSAFTDSLTDVLPWNLRFIK